MLRPRERRRPQMPNQLSPISSSGSLRSRSGHPGLFLRRIAAMLGARGVGRDQRVSANGVYKTLRQSRGDLDARQAAVVDRGLPRAPSRATTPGRDPSRTSTRTGRASWSASIAFSLGACSGHQGRGLADHRDRYLPSSFAWADLVRAPTSGPTVAHSTPALARRVAARSSPAAGWQPRRVLTDNGNEFRNLDFGRSPWTPRWGSHHSPNPRRAPSDQRSRRAPAPHDPRRVLATGVRALSPIPALHTACVATWTPTCTTTTTTAPTPDERRPGDARPTSSTVPAKWSRDQPQLSAQLGGCSA